VRTGAKSVIADCPVVVVLSTSLVPQTERILHSQIRPIKPTQAKYQHYVTRLTEKRFRVLKTHTNSSMRFEGVRSSGLGF